MNILGLSAYYHDSAACLVKDGQIIAAAQEERWSRKKHDSRFPSEAILYCLEEGQLQVADLDLVAYYDLPFLKLERLLETYLAFVPKGLRSFLQAMPLWIKEKIWLEEKIKKDLGFKGPLILTEHHQSHAASAFYPSPFDRSAILTIDGVGEWATASWGVGLGNRIQLAAELRFPHSLGLLYSAFTYFTGFKVNSGEYKVMGLAPYGEPKYVGIILDQLMDLKEDGSFKLNMDYFNYCQGLTMTNQKFADLFNGPPRQPESPLTQRELDLAASIQRVTEEVVKRMARHVYNQTGEKQLVLAGGVALNCVANGFLLREGPFKDLWIQPAAGDAGGALGAALFAWHQHLGQPRQREENKLDGQEGSYLGPAFQDCQIEEFLKEKGIPSKRFELDQLPKAVAGLLADGKIVGWFQGRMEFGPRALGCRSILGDPRNPNMQSIMNLKIKFRESFRPFAPSVLAERLNDYFNLDRPSPYMLLVGEVQDKIRKDLTPQEQTLSGIEKLKTIRSTIPAVTHIDYSARVQTVHLETNPLYHQLLQEFEAQTGCGVVVNTSFNVRGEPMVCTPDQAYACFMRTDMDFLSLGPFLVDKRDQPPWKETDEWRKGLLGD